MFDNALLLCYSFGLGYKGLSGAEFLQVQEVNAYKYRVQPNPSSRREEVPMWPNERICDAFCQHELQITETRRMNFELLTPCAIEPGKTTRKKCYETR
jgi:hypothetical protein